MEYDNNYNKKKVVIEKSEQRVDTSRSSLRTVSWRVVRPLLVLIISVTIVLTAILFGSQFIEKNVLNSVDKNDKTEVKVTIPRGASLSEISLLLEDAGLIKNKSVFKYYVDFSDQASKLHSGEYIFKKSMSMDEIIRMLSYGRDSRIEKKITLIEGLTIEEMSDKLVASGILKDKDKFLELCKTGSEFKDTYDFIAQAMDATDSKDRRYMLEGYMFPDTYIFFENTEPKDIITRMLDTFEAKFYSSTVWTERLEEAEMTMDEAVKLASIIEREARSKDFFKVSAVFHKRLEKDMLFQSCATLQYMFRLKKYSFSPSETSQKGPYNTYLNKGLPVGPISNPGVSTIQAALMPDEQTMQDGYLFFCNADPGTGELLFSKTNAEQNRNISKWKSTWDAYDDALLKKK